jgi:hypothetical protein
MVAFIVLTIVEFEMQNNDALLLVRNAYIEKNSAQIYVFSGRDAFSESRQTMM